MICLVKMSCASEAKARASDDGLCQNPTRDSKKNKYVMLTANVSLSTICYLLSHLGEGLG